MNSFLDPFLPDHRAIVQTPDVEIAEPDFTAVISEHNPSGRILSKPGCIFEFAGLHGFFKVLRIRVFVDDQVAIHPMTKPVFLHDDPS